VVDAANLLDLVELVKGDVMLTPEGRRFAEANMHERKTLFRRLALDNVEILRQIVDELRAKPRHRLKEQGLLDLLEQTFSPAESRRKLDTAIRWGRYAGLFSYDDERGEFRLRV
jgi:NitT/TauT family transport system ATP-binding protein